MEEKDYVKVVDINVPEGTQIIKVVLPEGKKLYQTQERLNDVWIFLQDN